MSKNVVVVDTAWGDTGKARVVDYLAQKARSVIRFNGSSNAGHTVYDDNGKKIVFHLVPAGVLHPGVVNYITSGVYINPTELVDEIQNLQAIGIKISPETLRISGNCHVIFEHHKVVDAEKEESLGALKIGTTKKGVGPAAVDKFNREGIRLQECFSDDAKILKPYIVDTVSELTERDRFYPKTSPLINLLFEGAQGAFLDIDHGSYPYVTSGNCVAQYAAVSAGIPAKSLHTVVGVVKAYNTRVGAGPFPTQMGGDFEERFRKDAGEFGATTGRPRKCGWLDLPALKYGIRVNGVDELALTRIDTLSGIDAVKVCTHYTINGKDYEEVPLDHGLLAEAIPNYVTLDGWNCEYSSRVIPTNAEEYVKFIEEFVNVPVKYLSYGPNRNEILER